MPRSVQTEKVSVSLKKEDLEVLRKRAKRLYGGNLSALLSDFAKLARYEDGADKLVDWLTESYKPGPDATAAIADEWRAPLPPAPKPAKSKKKAA
jgi:hypothetical protein